MGEGVEGEPLYITGSVHGLGGEPVGGAKLDLWQADERGLYEVQLEGQQEPYLRAVYRTKADGSFFIKSVSALGYPIPMDGPAGKLINQTDISYYRPAHVHFIIEAPGYQRLVTHIFRKDAPYLETDVVYGVKKELIVEFQRHQSGATPDGGHSDKPFTTVHYDFVLEKAEAKAAAA
jgi:hydroxyquinol 1,2-dioxygenase